MKDKEPAPPISKYLEKRRSVYTSAPMNSFVNGELFEDVQLSLEFKPVTSHLFELDFGVITDGTRLPGLPVTTGNIEFAKWEQMLKLVAGLPDIDPISDFSKAHDAVFGEDYLKQMKTRFPGKHTELAERIKDNAADIKKRSNNRDTYSQTLGTLIGQAHFTTHGYYSEEQRTLDYKTGKIKDTREVSETEHNRLRAGVEKFLRRK